MQVWNWVDVQFWDGGPGTQIYTTDVNLGSPTNVIASASITSLSVDGTTQASAGVTEVDGNAQWSDLPDTSNPCYMGSAQTITFQCALGVDQVSSVAITASYTVLST